MKAKDSQTISPIPELNVEQFKLLCMIAYFGEIPSDWTIGQVFSQKNVAHLKGVIQELENKSWIVSGQLRYDRYFEVVGAMLSHQRALVTRLDALGQIRYTSRQFMWKVAGMVHAEDVRELAALERPNEIQADISDYFGEMVLDPEWSCVRHLLTNAEKAKLTTSILQKRLRDDALDADFFDALGQWMKGAAWLTDDLSDMVELYRWFASGVDSNAAGGASETRWSLAHKAIKELYLGNVADALDLFTLALDKRYQPTGKQNSFNDPLVCWFYTVCVNRAQGLSKAVNISKQLASDPSFRFNAELCESRLLHSYIHDESQEGVRDVSTGLKELLETRDCRFHRALSYFLLRYFRCDDTKALVERFDLGRMPNAIVLRHELSQYLPLTVEEKDKLRQSFGGRPTLSAVRRLEPWELLLQGIEDSIATGSREKKRIVYFFDGLDLRGIVEESKAEGEDDWKSGNLLPRSRFMGEGYKSMDENDFRIATALRVKPANVSDAAVVLPRLLDSDRVFVGSYIQKPYTLASIEQEAPYLRFNARGNHIEFSSNVPCLEDGVPESVVTQIDESSYRCIIVNEKQRLLIQKFYAQENLPVAAMSSLLSAREALEKVIDVDMDFAMAAEMPAIQGSSALAVRVTPEGHEYRLCVQASPLRDGELRFSPGEGEAVIYDTADGVTSRIARNLELEYANYCELREFVRCEMKTDFETYQEAVFATSHSLLKLLSYTHDNPERFFMEWPEGRALKFHGEVGGNVNIQVLSNVNWFEIEGSVNVAGKLRSLAELMAMYHNSDLAGYLKVGEREYAKMSDTLRKHIHDLETIGKVKGKHIRVPACQIGNVAQFIESAGDIYAMADEQFRTTLRRMEEAYASTPQLPADLNAEMRDYQREGFEWMARLGAWGAGACLADDMGLGKTLQSLALMLSRADMGPSLVVAPLSVIPNWAKEAARFVPTMKVKILNESSDRITCINAAGPGDILLTSYGVLVSSEDAIAKKVWNVLCLDEAHQIKNRATRASQAAMAMTAKQRLILTGTPVQNHLGELWNLFQFINPGLLGPWTEFNDTYIRDELTSAKRSQLQKLTQPFILRRTKEQVLKDLPEKNIYNRPVELTREEMLAYEDMRKLVEAKFKKGKSMKEKAIVEGLHIEFLAELTHLREAANDMRLLGTGWKEESSKIVALMDIMATLRENPENRILIFSQFTSFLDNIGLALKREGVEYLYLDGSTPMRERHNLVDKFQNGECPVFLVSLKAGGLGLNLTAANYVIMMDPWWNPAIEDQAADRAYRIGQERVVTVIRLVAQHTIEEKIIRLHESKRDLSDMVLEGTADSSKLSFDDMLELVSL